MKKTALYPSSDFAVRFARIMHRKLDTPWNADKEISKFRKMSRTITADDLTMVERYYAAHWPPRTNVNMLRHDLATLINNWQGEVDRARAWSERQKAKVAAVRKVIPLPRSAVSPPMSEEERKASADQFAALMGRRPSWEKLA